jgi:spermidine/putrescine-binding protein
MTVSFRRTAVLLAAAAAACSLAGCASINDKLTSGMGEYIPLWAGGLPADAPPRPGTAKYDEFMKERERRRQQPAAERDDSDKTASSMAQSAPAR